MSTGEVGKCSGMRIPIQRGNVLPVLIYRQCAVDVACIFELMKFNSMTLHAYTSRLSIPCADAHKISIQKGRDVIGGGIA